MGLPMDKSYLLTQLKNFKSIILDPAYIIQKTTLPTATADLEGVVYQYIGNSSSLTLGGFYQCQSDGAVSPTYSWKLINDDLQAKTLTTPVEGATTVEGALGALSTNKADKVSSATNGNFAGLDANGNLTDSGKKPSDFQTALTFDNAPTENSNNPVKSGGVYAADQKLYKLDAAYGVKNLAPRLNSQTINNVTFNINDDGSITVNGTATSDCWYDICGQDINNFLQAGENYIASGCPEGGRDATFFMYIGGTYLKYVVDDTSFTCDAAKRGHFYICVRTNTVMDNVVFYPMIRHASYVNDTYQPYAKTNKQLTDDAEALTNQANDMVNVLGAKNLIPYPYHRQNGYTTNGATFTYDDEGVITVNKVVGNSTAYFALFSNILYPDAEKFLEPNTSYILSMELENATDTSCFVQAQNGSDIAAIRNKATGKYEISFTTTETVDSLTVGLYYGAEITENNAKVKLMIRLASIQDDTWVPYVPTNKELMSCKLNGYVGAKNLLPYPYYHTTKTENGLTITDNGDGTVAIAGTATSETTFYLNHTNIGAILGKGSYVLSGCPTGGNRANGYYIEISGRATSTDSWTVLATDIGEGAAFTVTEAMLNWVAMHVFIRVRSGKAISSAITFNPMLRHIEDTDSTWQPYAKTNRQLTEDSVDWESNSILGAKNFLTNKGTATTQGVEFAVDSNGVFTVTRKSAGSGHAYYSNGRFTLKPGTYIFSNGYDSLPSGIQATYLYNHTDGVYFTNCNNGPKTFTITEEKELAFNIEVQTTQSPSGVKIYPMIRLASDTDPTYQPYAMTNQELTKVNVAEVNISIQTSELTQYRVRKWGKIVECTISLQVNEAVTAWTDFATVPEGFRPSTYIQAVNNKTIYTGFAVMQINPNGGIQSAVNLAVGDRVRFTAVWICS